VVQPGVGIAVVTYHLTIRQEMQQGTPNTSPVRVAGRIDGTLDIDDDGGIIWIGGPPLTLVTEHSERFSIQVKSYMDRARRVEIIGWPAED
jgi:hypothetical protein